MSGWGEYAAAWAAFLASHAAPVQPPVRAWLVARLGRTGYLAGFVALSLAALAWLVVAAGRAPWVPLWEPAAWQRWVPNLAMPLVCLLIAHALAAPNPLSFGGRAAGFDPDRPGIAGVARHPLLWALALWSAAHLPPNGDLAHVLLFGGFAVFALAGMRAIDRRLQRQRGMPEWQRLARLSSTLPLAALVSGRWRPGLRLSPARILAGFALWLGLLALHPWATGLSPLP